MNIFSPKKKLLIFQKITCKVPKTNKKSTPKKVLFACDFFLIFTAVKHKEFPLSTNSLGKNLNNSKTVKTVTLAVIYLPSHFHLIHFIYQCSSIYIILHYVPKSNLFISSSIPILLILQIILHLIYIHHILLLHRISTSLFLSFFYSIPSLETRSVFR